MRLFTDGAEMRTTQIWTVASGIAIANSSPAPFLGDWYYKMQGAWEPYIGVNWQNEIYFRERIYVNDSTMVYIPRFRSTSINLGCLSMESSTNHLIFYSNNFWYDTGVAMTPNAWHLIEIYFKIADVNGRFIIYLNNNLIADWTGDTKIEGYSSFNNIQWQAGGGSAIIGLDDLAMNDTSNADGLNDNSWCGDASVLKITPDGNGAHNNWHGSDLDDVDNYLLVDEYPHDSDTTYVYHTGDDAGVQDQYAMSDLVASGYTIRRVWTVATARKTNTSYDDRVKLGFLPPGGSDELSDEIALSTGYAEYRGDWHKVNPADGLPWEEADLDSIEAIIETGSSSSSSSSSSQSSSSSSTTSSSSSSAP